MSRYKQTEIEEMAKDLCDIDCKGMKCNVCDSYGCEYRMQAEALYNAGYRKASEVVRKIFEEIGKILRRFDEIAERDKSEYGELIVGDITMAIAELEKKYTEDGE